MSSLSKETDRVVAVDLDGTLLRTDLSWELMIAYLRPAPWRIGRLFFWTRTGGVARLKVELARHVAIDGGVLPWNGEVVKWCGEQSENGARVVLATASPLQSAREVTSHFPFISEVLGSDERRNLKAEKKAGELMARYGPGGFDYVGNSSADVPVWRAAKAAFFVGTQGGRDRYAARLGGNALVWIGGANERGVLVLARALRPHQWLKNLLMLVPLLAAHRWDDEEGWHRIVPALLAVCCVASAAYVINDLADLDADRRHPRKKYRPLASGDLQIPHGVGAVVALMGAGFGLACWSGVAAVLATLGYLGLSLTYSLAVKKAPFADVAWLSGMYSYRVIIGGAITGTMVSPWLLAYSASLFLGLAFMKRHIELVAVGPAHEERVPGRGYAGGDARWMRAAGVGACTASVVVLACYLQSPASRILYARPEWLWPVVLGMAAWLARIWVMAGRKKVDDDPVWFAAKDPATWLLAATCLAAIALAGPLK